MKNNSSDKTPLRPEFRGIGTQCVQAGYVPTVGDPRILPIVQSTTYKYEDLEQVERLFALQESGYKYPLTGNPT